MESIHKDQGRELKEMKLNLSTKTCLEQQAQPTYSMQNTHGITQQNAWSRDLCGWFRVLPVFIFVYFCLHWLQIMQGMVSFQKQILQIGWNQAILGFVSM